MIIGVNEDLAGPRTIRLKGGSKKKLKAADNRMQIECLLYEYSNYICYNALKILMSFETLIL
jgi:hypothetical protein